MSSKIAAAAAAVILLAASCGEESPSITAPTAPSPISTTTQAAPPQLAGAADGTAMPADPGEIAFNEPQYRASSYTYTPGVPGNPRHVQVRATGDSYVATIDNETAEKAIKDRYEIAPRATGFNVTFDVPEGKWTVVARSRNSRGWGIRGVKRANVEVEYGISTPGRPTNLAWNNSRISWDPPLDNGGLPLQKYEYFPATMCPSIAGTPYPLDIRDRYTLKNHQVRVHWSPTIDGISMCAWNNAGPSPCINHEF